ncbi:MAG: sce7725 family protein [Victivallaceae bacterium]|nr:sce7725 family protein [Victivallaceae bacterium]
MYYPYLRGKQFELILLRDNADLLAENNIHPIIEPVKNDFSALRRAMKVINEQSIGCTLIINPLAGKEPVSSTSISDIIDTDFNDFNNISIGYILDAKSNLKDLSACLDKYYDKTFTLIHYGYSNGTAVAATIAHHQNIKRHIFIDGFAGKLYQRHLKKDDIERILIRNGFKAQKKNSLYPESEHFSDLHITYPDEGMDGFGDYLIVGDDYTETGGPAYAVAIHLTYLATDDDMFIYHFISDQTDSPTNPGGKFLEALNKLVREINKPNSLIYKSTACTEYIDLYKKQHYPGLGTVKKLSMQHHIELMTNFIQREN